MDNIVFQYMCRYAVVADVFVDRQNRHVKCVNYTEDITLVTRASFWRNAHRLPFRRVSQMSNACYHQLEEAKKNQQKWRDISKSHSESISSSAREIPVAATIKEDY